LMGVFAFFCLGKFMGVFAIFFSLFFSLLLRAFNSKFVIY